MIVQGTFFTASVNICAHCSLFIIKSLLCYYRLDIQIHWRQRLSHLCSVLKTAILCYVMYVCMYFFLFLFNWIGAKLKFKKKKNESRRYEVCRLLVSRVSCYFKLFSSVSSMLVFFWKMTTASLTNRLFQSKRNQFLNF